MKNTAYTCEKENLESGIYSIYFHILSPKKSGNTWKDPVTAMLCMYSAFSASSDPSFGVSAHPCHFPQLRNVLNSAKLGI